MDLTFIRFPIDLRRDLIHLEETCNDLHAFPDLNPFQPFGHVFKWIHLGSSSLLSIRLRSRIPTRLEPRSSKVTASLTIGTRWVFKKSDLPNIISFKFPCPPAIPRYFDRELCKIYMGITYRACRAEIKRGKWDRTITGRPEARRFSLPKPVEDFSSI